MKKKYILCLMISLVTLLYTSCSDDEVVRMSDRKVAFMQEEIAVTRAGGDVDSPHGVESDRLDTEKLPVKVTL